MPGNRKLQRNGSATDRVEEAIMRRLKVEGTDDNGRVGDEPESYPDRPGEPDCIYYLRTGSCGYGSNCRFNHPSNAAGQGNGSVKVYGGKNTSELPERAGQPDCVFYLKTGTCKYGSTCKYHHPKDRLADVLNALGLPMRQDTRPCPYYMRTGLCKYGSACKFHHPPPALPANVLPVLGPVYGSGGALTVPSSAATSIGELSSASLSKTAYFGGSLQLPQSYMPLFLPSPPGWNTYMGSSSPLSVAGILTAPGSNAQLSVPYLPERPDQPECRYFMNHGSCKYGSDCKYHHPRERISQIASSSFGPFRLPLRPGQPVCSNYSLYGICKYGSMCKYDHPSYAYSLAIPPPLPAYPPSGLYQRTTLTISEVPLSKSSNLSDWISNGPTASNGNQHSNVKRLEDSPDRSDSRLHSSKASSEVIHDGSD